MATEAAPERFHRICIIGTGQIGCSLAALIRQKNLADEVIGVDRDPVHLEMARELKLVDRAVTDPARGVMGAQAVVAAVPVDEVFKVLEASGPDLRPGALVTCTAGTTARIRTQVVKAVPAAANFVPSFPLVFSNRLGPGGASASLLEGQACMVSLSETTPEPAVRQVRHFWRALGMEAQPLEAEVFEWRVVGSHYWPLLLARLVSRVAARSRWPGGSTALGRWLTIISSDAELARSNQLHAARLAALLEEMVEEIAQEQHALGAIPASARVAVPRMKRRPVVAVDGPAGSGKSTVARRVAQALGYQLVDTGAIYRCLAVAARWAGIADDDAKGLAEVARNLKFRFEERGENRLVWIGTEEVTELIREPAVSQAASKVSAIPDVRQALLKVQRDLAAEGGAVLEGRDIGTVVFPDAEVKVFLQAPVEVRAQRRFEEIKAAGKDATLEQVTAEVTQRDQRDESRTVAPMKPAADAVIVDTGPLSVGEVVQHVLNIVREKIAGDKPEA